MARAIDGGWGRAVAMATIAALSSGCFIFGGSSSGGNDDDDFMANDDADPAPQGGALDPVESLRGCADGYTREQVEDTIQITYDFSDSAHEMVVCGGLVSAIVVALVQGVIQLVQDPQSSTLPDQYRYDGAGGYVVEVGSARDLAMEVRFYLAEDFAFGRRGDLVTPNLFDLDSYLVDPRTSVQTEITPTGISIEVEIDHAGPGPLVELLGYGTNPPNPIVLTGNAIDLIADRLGNLEVDATISLTDHPSVSSIRYDVESPRMLARSLLTGAALQLDMLDAAGDRADLRQSLAVHTWTVDYVDGAVGALEGDIGFTVRGDRFDFDALLHYPRAGYPDIELKCAE